MRHPCSSFHDAVQMPYKDRAFRGDPPRLDEKFAEGQIFESKSILIAELGAFHLDKNIEFIVLNSNKKIYRVRCKSHRCP